VTYVVHPDRYSRTGVSVRKNRVVIHTAESSEGSRVEDVLINFMGAAGNLTVPGSNPPRVFGAAYTAIPDSAKGTYREAYDAARLGVYAQGGANKDSWSFCIPGRASQTRAEWLDGYSRECIRIAARYTVDKCRLDDIPLVRKSWQQIAVGERGYCDHYTISLAFKKSDHTDVGPNFPWDVFAADIDAIVNPPQPTPDPPPTDPEDAIVFTALIQFAGHDALYAAYSDGTKKWVAPGSGQAFRGLLALAGKPTATTVITDPAVFRACGPISGPVPTDVDEYGVPV
jgi:hypothetical protein